jgi:hypothetical protein
MPAGRPGGTVDCAVQDPLASVPQLPTVWPSMVMWTESPAAKPLTFALKVEPGSPELGESSSPPVTVKVADAGSPLSAPVPMTV